MDLSGDLVVLFEGVTPLTVTLQELVSFDPSLTFWSYLLVRTLLGVLTAASLMMFEGAVMATIQVQYSAVQCMCSACAVQYSTR